MDKVDCLIVAMRNLMAGTNVLRDDEVSRRGFADFPASFNMLYEMLRAPSHRQAREIFEERTKFPDDVKEKQMEKELKG